MDVQTIIRITARPPSVGTCRVMRSNEFQSAWSYNMATTHTSQQSRKRRHGNVDPPDSSALDLPTSVPRSAAKRMCSDPKLGSPSRWNNTQLVEYLRRNNFHSTVCEAFRGIANSCITIHVITYVLPQTTASLVCT